MRTALILAAALVAAPAAAQDVCGRYDDPLAYNACLARQGPAARTVHIGAAPAARSTTHRARGQIATVSRHGRSEMVFSVGR